MRIIKPNAQYIDVDNTHPYQIMEKAGRTCYKSEKNITPESAAKFVKNMAEHKHTAMLEHAHVYMELNEDLFHKLQTCLNHLMCSDMDAMDTIVPFIHITEVRLDNSDKCKYYVSASFRTFLHMFYSDVMYCFDSVAEINKLLSDEYPEIFEPDEAIENIYQVGGLLLTRKEFIDNINKLPIIRQQKQAILMKHVVHTVVFTCDRGVTHEFVRHRPASFAQESTRYCNYSKDAFGNEITVIDPLFWSKNDPNYTIWKDACEYAEKKYFELINNGAVAQQARSVLPNELKTELVITATEAEWQHIINLRLHGTTGAPHPQIKEVMEIAYPVLTEKSDHRLS